MVLFSNLFCKQGGKQQQPQQQQQKKQASPAANETAGAGAASPQEVDRLTNEVAKQVSVVCFCVSFSCFFHFGAFLSMVWSILLESD